MAVTVKVRYEIVETVQGTDLCPQCWLPSMWVVSFTMQIGGQMPTLGSVTQCGDCGFRPDGR